MKHLLTFCALLLFSAGTSALYAETPIVTAASSASNPLTVPYQDAAIQIDGSGADPVWSKIAPLTHFKYYWNPEEPQRTELRLFHNGKDLCFLYTVEDSDILKTTVINEEMDIAEEDRVEFGLSSADPLRPYYFFEIDTEGRVLDYEAVYYRKFDDSWDSKGLEVLGRETETGYEVEGKFDLRELRELGLLDENNQMLAGFFRGDYVHGLDDENNHKWISWVYSETAHPDFHIHSAFGTVQLEAQ